MELTETDRAYLAGLIDGEGCINISITQGRYYVLQVITAQTNEYLLDYWQKKTGLGNVYKGNETRGNRSAKWQWVCAHHVAEELLKMAQPYLLLKREEARLALEFMSVCGNQQKQFRGKGKPRLTPDMLAVRKTYKDAMHALKRQRAGAEVEKPLTVHYALPKPAQMNLF